MGTGMLVWQNFCELIDRYGLVTKLRYESDDVKVHILPKCCAVAPRIHIWIPIKKRFCGEQLTIQYRPNHPPWPGCRQGV